VGSIPDPLNPEEAGAAEPTNSGGTSAITTKREAPRTALLGAVQRTAVYVFSGAMRESTRSSASVYALANTAAGT
jgi:hypothetical protein